MIKLEVIQNLSDVKCLKLQGDKTHCYITDYGFFCLDPLFEECVFLFLTKYYINIMFNYTPQLCYIVFSKIISRQYFRNDSKY